MELLKPVEAAELLNVNVHTLKQWIYQGKIRSIKTPGGHHRIPRSEIDRFTSGDQTSEPELSSKDSKEARRRILVAEDNLDSRELLAKLLPSWGYDVTVASTATEALQLARIESFDLYIIDNWLPDGAGAELCRRIREDDSATPVVFYSALKSDEEKRKAFEAGAQNYIEKPHFDELQIAISSHLRSNQKAHR